MQSTHPVSIDILEPANVSEELFEAVTEQLAHDPKRARHVQLN